MASVAFSFLSSSYMKNLSSYKFWYCDFHIFTNSLGVILFSVVEVRRKSVDGVWSEPSSPVRSGLMSPPLARPSPFHISDCSNSSWAEIEPFVIGNVQMYPPNLATKQYFILKYLTPMGEYQEVSDTKSIYY